MITLGDAGASSPHDWCLTPVPCPWDSCRSRLYAPHGGRLAACASCGYVWGGYGAPEQLAASSLALLRDSIRRRAAIDAGEGADVLALLPADATVIATGRGESRRWVVEVDTLAGRRRVLGATLEAATSAALEVRHAAQAAQEDR